MAAALMGRTRLPSSEFVFAMMIFWSLVPQTFELCLSRGVIFAAHYLPKERADRHSPSQVRQLTMMHRYEDEYRMSNSL
jgi:hypothetical protein